MKLGDLSSTQDSKDNHGESSEGEHSEETTEEVKKPRLGGSSESQENNDNLEILEERNLAEGKTDYSGELAEEKVGDKDQTKGLNQEDKILRILQDMHEDVPLEDPGPNIAIEDGGYGVAGETQ